MYGFYDPAGVAGSFTQPFNPGFLKDLVNRRPERTNAFEAYRRQRDPDGVFCNDFVGQLLGH
jgi:hypothetical protein